MQLNDEPSWLRGDVLEGVEVGAKGEVYGLDLEGERWDGKGMVLLEEVETSREARDVKKGDLKRLIEELQGLGIESKGLLGKVEGKSLGFSIEEKEVSEVAVPPVEVEAGMAALAIEGYTPRRGPEDYLPKNRKVQVLEE